VGGRTESIAKTLERLGATEAKADLLKSLREADTEEARSNFTRMLAAMGAREAIPDIQKLLHDPSPRVRTTAVRALQDLGARETAPAIRDLLKEKNPSILIAAVQALGALSAKEAVPDLEAFLAHENSSLRTRSLQALRDLESRDSIPRMMKLLEDPDAMVRQRAVRLLGQMNAREALPQLLTKVADEGTRVEALEALDRMDADEAISEVRPLLKHPFSSVRVMAAAWLCGRGVREGAALLIEESRDLTALNGLRNPELWRKLRRTPWERSSQHSSKDLPAFLAKEWGVTLEGPPDAKEWVQMSSSPIHETTTVMEILRNDAMQTRCQAIADKDRIRLLPYEDALAFWKKWLTDEGNKIDAASCSLEAGEGLQWRRRSGRPSRPCGS
jgi:HEAT repeat protein